MLLELIPLANLLFMWTNIVGCALWVADEIEKAERTTMAQQQEPQQQPTLTPGGGSGGAFSPPPQSSSSLSPSSPTIQDQPQTKKTGSRLSWFGRSKDQLRQRDQEQGPGQV